MCHGAAVVLGSSDERGHGAPARQPAAAASPGTQRPTSALRASVSFASVSSTKAGEASASNS
eukprot:4494963-Prymnesium_polylepis.1